MLNMILKSIFTVFILLAIFVAFVFNGIKIDTLSFDDFNIKQLYLKYDKNLILDFKLESSDINLGINSILTPTFKVDGKIAKIKKLEIKYHKDLEDLVSNSGDIVLNADSLQFNLEKAFCQGINLYDSKIKIYNDNLQLKFNSHNLLDHNLHKVLKVYDIDLDINQKEGKNNNIYVSLDIPFDNKPTKIFTNIKSENTKVNINKTDIEFDKFYIDLEYIKDTITANTRITERNMSFAIKSNINLNKNISNGTIQIKSLKYENILDIKDKKFDYHLDFNKELIIKIPQLGFDYKKSKNIHNIKVKNLTDLVKYTTLDLDLSKSNIELKSEINLDTNISTGNVSINNFKYKDIIDVNKQSFNYKFDFGQTKLTIPRLGLNYTKHNSTHSIYIKYFNKVAKYINFIDVNNNIQSDIRINSKDSFETTNVNINKLNFKFNQLFFKKSDLDENEEKLKFPKLKINLHNGFINYKDYDINYSNLEINTNKLDINAWLHINGKDNIKITTIINDNNLTINSNKITSEFVNEFLKKDILKDGFITLNSKGTFDKLSGKITLHNTTVKNVQILNNLITFINTTPAIINPILALPTLFRLSETKFDTTGYYIQEGFIDFIYDIKMDKLKLPSIYTKSKMMDFKARADIDLDTKELKAYTDVIFMKDHSKVLKHIPVVGYIITGDDGNFITQVDIDGSLDEPKFETHTIENATKGAVNVLKRIVNLPQKVLQDINITEPSSQSEDNSSKDSINNNIVEDVVGGTVNIIKEIITLPIKILEDANFTDPEPSKTHQDIVDELFNK